MGLEHGSGGAAGETRRIDKTQADQMAMTLERLTIVGGAVLSTVAAGGVLLLVFVWRGKRPLAGATALVVLAAVVLFSGAAKDDEHPNRRRSRYPKEPSQIIIETTQYWAWLPLDLRQPHLPFMMR